MYNSNIFSYFENPIILGISNKEAKFFYLAPNEVEILAL
jgi:hypothetical protein